MKLINLTPHEIVLVGANGEPVLRLPSSGSARCTPTVDQQEPLLVDGVEVPVIARQMGAVTGLPDAQPGVRYIVSIFVLQALPGREDLLAPGDLVRDGANKVIGCSNLARS